MDIPLIICMVSGLFYGAIWVLNKDLIWQTPLHRYASYHDWFAANNPKGLWYFPLVGGLLWPHNYRKVSFDPMPDFLWERLAFTVLALISGLMLAKFLKGPS